MRNEGEGVVKRGMKGGEGGSTLRLAEGRRGGVQFSLS